jgi:hypothetical protein
MKRTLLFVGIAAVLVGMGLVMPAVALLRDTGALPGFEVGLLILGLAMTLGGVGSCVYGARYRQAK